MKHYVLCGLSGRGLTHFALPILGLTRDGTPALESYESVANLAAVIEPDLARAAAFNDWLQTHGRAALPRYDDLATAVSKTHPDTAIVASVDNTHCQHILDALRLDLDVVTEKPMVTTTADAQRVVDAERESKGRVIVGHNFRYPPQHIQLKRLIQGGRIGRVVQVLLEYHVDTVHGSSYYVRWHRHRMASGGMTLTKSTHHLDLISWLLHDEPVRVAAFGGLHFYGPTSPHRPRTEAGDPLVGQDLRANDPYRRAREQRLGSPIDGCEVSRGSVLGLPYSGYQGQGDVSVYDDDIDTLDTITSVLSYSRGASAAYLVNFSSPWEGFRLVVTGTHGQIEAITGFADGIPMPGSDIIVVRPLFGSAEFITVDTAEGSHGGADPLLRHDLFVGPSHESIDLGLMAGAREGALAVAAGEAIWRSIESGQTVAVNIS